MGWHIRDAKGAPIQANASGIQYKDVQLNNAQIRALLASPHTVVLAPGVGLIPMPIMAAGHQDFVVGYTGGSSQTVKLGFSGTGQGDRLTIGGLSMGLTTPRTAMYDSSESFNGIYLPSDNDVVGNLPLEIYNDGGAEWGGGDPANTLSIRIWYAIVPTIAFGA